MSNVKYVGGVWKLRPQETRIVIVAHGREVDASGFGATVAIIDGWWNGEYGASSSRVVTGVQSKTARLLVLAPRLHRALERLYKIWTESEESDIIIDELQDFWVSEGESILTMLDADTTPRELLEGLYRGNMT